MKKLLQERTCGKIGPHSPSGHGSLFENYITLEELLKLLRHQYSKHSIYRWVQRSNMPHKKIRGRLWFPRYEVEKWLERS